MHFSIIIPCFNSEATIRRAIDSALAQSEAEVIVVDDGSTDHTLKIACSYASVRAFNRVTNQGPGVARNIGLDNAQGNWVIFLDADDMLFPGALKRLDEFIASHPVDLDLIGFNWIGNHDTDGMRRDGHWLNGTTDELLKAYVSLRMDGAVTFTAFRRDILKEIRFRDGFHEDVDFLYSCYERAQYPVYFDNIMYLKCGSGITGTVTEKHIDGFQKAWLEVLTAYCPYINSLDWPSAEVERGIIGVVATRVREIYRKGGSSMDPLVGDINIQTLLAYFRNNLPPLFWNVCQDTELQTQYAKIAREFVNHGMVELSLFGKTWSCKDLQHSAYLAPNEIRACCKRFFVGDERRGDVVLIRDLEKQPTAHSIMEAKRDMIERNNTGEETGCSGCPFMEFKEWPKVTEDVEYLSLEHHSVCNLRCSYCSDTYYGGERPSYNVEALVADLAPSLKTVVWGGGEPTLGPEFRTLSRNFALSGVQQRILSNSVIYSSDVHHLINDGKAELFTSIDAGTPETFKKVRGADKLHAVLSNLGKYSSKRPDLVTIKYILTEDNCSSFEIEQFVALVKDRDLSRCNFMISADFRQPEATEDEATAVMLLHGLLVKEAGAGCVFIDDLCRIRINDAPLDHWNDGSKLSLAQPHAYPEVILWGRGEQAKRLRDDALFFRHANIAFEVDSSTFDKDMDTDLPIVIAASQAYPAIYHEIVSLGLGKRIVRELVI